MFCGNCGTENPDDNNFCKSCGEPLKNLDSSVTSKLPDTLGNIVVPTFSSIIKGAVVPALKFAVPIAILFGLPGVIIGLPLGLGGGFLFWIGISIVLFPFIFLLITFPLCCVYNFVKVNHLL